MLLHIRGTQLYALYAQSVHHQELLCDDVLDSVRLLPFIGVIVLIYDINPPPPPISSRSTRASQTLKFGVRPDAEGREARQVEAVRAMAQETLRV